jgi:hypothetical protein
MTSGVASSAPWRKAALDDRPRPGGQPTITLEAKAWLVSLACRKAKDRGYPRNCGRQASRPSRWRVWTVEGTCMPLSPSENPQAGGRVAEEPGIQEIASGFLFALRSRLKRWPIKRKHFSLVFAAIRQGYYAGRYRRATCQAPPSLYGCTARWTM